MTVSPTIADLPTYEQSTGESSRHIAASRAPSDKKAKQFPDVDDPAPHRSPPSRPRSPRIQIPADLEYTRNSDGDIVVTDRRANEDPGFLSGVLRHFSSCPPSLEVSVSGSRWIDESADGPDTTPGDHIRRTDRRKINDFHFTIPLTTTLLIQRQPPSQNPDFFTHTPESKTFRGGMWRRRWRSSDDTVPGDQEGGLGDEMVPLSVGQLTVLQYLGCRAPLKSLVVEKRWVGWNIRRLRAAIERVLRSAPLNYRHEIHVRLTASSDRRVIIRPDNSLTRFHTSELARLFRWVCFPVGLAWTLWYWVLGGGARWSTIGVRFYLHRTEPEAGIPLDHFLVLFAPLILNAAQARVNDGSPLTWPNPSTAL
ncbi:hypothetical protein PYCC9005_000634 [Savitreella phatthalungensis]